MAESRADNQTSNQTGTTRRSVVRGAAWSVPVVAAATAAPAFAASPIPCPIVPPGSQWSATTVDSGTISAKNDDYAWGTDGKWTIYRDNGSSTTSVVFSSTSPSFAVRPGSTLTGTYSFFWGYGNGSSNASAQGTFEILFVTASAATVVGTVSRPGSALGTTTQSVTFTVPAGVASGRLRYRYTIAPQGNRPASDDISVGPVSFGTCTVN